MSERKFVRYPARDGLLIPAWLTIPKGSSGKNLPLVVNIHGGPFVRGHGYGFDADAQFLASRGYAVLQPEFRGSPGYGQRLFSAGLKQWGLAMQDDISDGVAWLARDGIADKGRVCLMGGSYGGYATLWGLIKEPDAYRCGVASVAVTDIHQAEKLKAPVLLAFGGSDQRVPIKHGNEFRSALDKHGKTYEWVVYSDEGHGFNKDENSFDFYRRVDAFLKKHLAAP